MLRLKSYNRAVIFLLTIIATPLYAVPSNAPPPFSPPFPPGMQRPYNSQVGSQPSPQTMQQLNQLFNKAGYQYFQKQKKVELFKIPEKDE